MSTATSAPRPVAGSDFPHQQSSAISNGSASQSCSSTDSFNSPASTSAPLPSPSSSVPRHDFFGSLNQQHQSPQDKAQHPSSYDYRPSREESGRTAAETTSFLNTSALLAEAAKRAQIAVVMRDIEGMEL